MLDVHAPEHPLTTKREFLLHLLTITIGLLIALALENAAEWVHHQHQRREADANITKELRDNEKDVSQVLTAIDGEAKNLLAVLHFLKAHQLGQKQGTDHLTLNFNLATLHDASWQTANATGTLSFMEYEHVERYAAAYTLQAQFKALQDSTLNSFLLLQSHVAASDDPNQLSPEETAATVSQVQQALANLIATQQIGRAVQKQYEEALKAD